MSTGEWFLDASERGNPATEIPIFDEGNLVVAHIHGSAYFDRLVDEVRDLDKDDHLFFTDWRGDHDELMRAGGPTVGELFSAAARRGVVVKGLMWRSHSDKVAYSQEENRQLGDEVHQAGGEVLLDQRVRRAGSHHQKLVVLRHLGEPERDVAFVGGIDLCHGRRDDADHHGDPQPPPMSEEYGKNPPWHDVQLEIRGPAIGALDTTFRERWFDPTSLDMHDPLAWVKDKLTKVDLSADPLPDQPPDPPPCGPHAVQVRRTYPSLRPGYDFAPQGERSVARGYGKAVRRAKRLIYLEDQYMWSTQVAKLFAEALRDQPELHLVVVVPRFPDVDGRLALPPNQVGRAEAIAMCEQAGQGRVHVFDVENRAGTPVYIHAKVCVVDDIWASVGSDNFNRRSWTHDSELSCGVLDSTYDERQPQDPTGNGDRARTFARDLRLALWREHLDLPADGSRDGNLVDPATAVEAVAASARALEDWHERDRAGTRPPGRLRPHRPERLPRRTKLWALPAYRLIYDPDGRSWRDKFHRRW